MSFGFGPNNGGSDEPRDDSNDPSKNEPNGQPDFEKMLRNFTQQFSQQFSQQFGLTGANLAPGQAGAQLIATETVRKIAREVCGDGSPIGTNQQKDMKEAIDIANLWLDPEIIFPASLTNSNPAWNMRD